jgi:anaerobic ribonucleoside-triphosphate reductase
MAEILADGYLTVSFVGLAETLTSLVGRHHGQREDAARLGIEIVRMMRDYCDEASEKNGLQIWLQAGQDSGVACELVTADRARFGRIAGVTDIAHYTAGFCLPTRQATPILERIRIESPYHQLVQSGQILTIDLPVGEGDPAAAIEGIIQAAAKAKIKQVSFRKK